MFGAEGRLKGQAGVGGGQGSGEDDGEGWGQTRWARGGYREPTHQAQGSQAARERLGPCGAGPATWQAAIPALGAPPPRPTSGPPRPAPARSARMWVTCGRHLPVPGSQRQSEPARAAAAITAAAKSSARCPRHVSRRSHLHRVAGAGRRP